MVNIFFGDPSQIADRDIDLYLQIFPQAMQGEIRRLRNKPDQKCRLLSRLILYFYLNKQCRTDLINGWTRGKYGKPYIPQWLPFNITHTDGLVVVACAQYQIGIDAEKQKKINERELITFFHPNEQNYIVNSPDINMAFYEIWVKKEAFLKAVGTGLNDKINQVDCRNDSIDYEGRTWYFHRVSVNKNFITYLCSFHAKECINIIEVNINDHAFHNR